MNWLNLLLGLAAVAVLLALVARIAYEVGRQGREQRHCCVYHATAHELGFDPMGARR